jgi:hypothetical protein
MSFQFYAYGHSNPVNNIDPLGEFTMSDAMATVTIIGIQASQAIAALTPVIQTVAVAAAGAAAIVCVGAGAISAVSSVGSGGPCDITNFSIFHSTWLIPETTQHTAEAIYFRGKPGVLTRRVGSHPRGWLKSTPECKGNVPKVSGKWCDEYPFASTKQGGQANRPSLKLVSAKEQQVQGGLLGGKFGFYKACRIVPGDPHREDFGVLPGGPVIPPWVCALQAEQTVEAASNNEGIDVSLLEPILVEAASRWEEAGVDAQPLENLKIQVLDLPGNILGLARPTTIFVDHNAAGHGWFLDTTPNLDEEFMQGTAISTDAENRMDLLTLLMHEFGHILGHPDLDFIAYPSSLMAGILTSGERREPNSTDGRV